MWSWAMPGYLKIRRQGTIWMQAVQGDAPPGNHPPPPTPRRTSSPLRYLEPSREVSEWELEAQSARRVAERAFLRGMVARAGVEPATFHFSGERCYQLSYLAVLIVVKDA